MRISKRHYKWVFFLAIASMVAAAAAVGQNIVTHVPPFERKKSAWFTIFCSMRLYAVILILNYWLC